MIETAIRNAFEKGNADDRAFREKVYRSAFAALDRALKANPGVTVELAMSRRKNLQAKITEIESEFIPAVPAMDTPTRAAPPPPARENVAPSPRVDTAPPAAPMHAAPPVSMAPREASPLPLREAPPVTMELEDAAPEPGIARAPAAASIAPAVSIAPSVVAAARPVSVEPDFDVLPEPMAAPAVDRPLAGSTPSSEPMLTPEPVLEREPVLQQAPASAGDGFDIRAQNEPARERRRRPLAVFFVIVTLLALIGIGGWWAVRTGLIKLPDELSGAVPNPPQTTEEEDFDPDEEGVGAPALPGETDSRDWVSVFTPSDPTLVSAPGDTSAEVMQDDTGSFIRIRSSASGSAIAFDVGQGVLEKLAGKKAAFDIVARASEEGKDTQISVICNFGELGDCGRKRYAVGITKADYLFEIDLPAKAPGAGGTIAINTDFEGGGKAIDIYEIKVAVSP